MVVESTWIPSNQSFIEWVSSQKTLYHRGSCTNQAFYKHSLLGLGGQVWLCHSPSGHLFLKCTVNALYWQLLGQASKIVLKCKSTVDPQPQKGSVPKMRTLPNYGAFKMGPGLAIYRAMGRALYRGYFYGGCPKQISTKCQPALLLIQTSLKKKAL